MAKAFLSHSSKDKRLVGPIFEELNAASVHYDAVTFETGSTSAQNIVDAMSDTDVFVLFVSKSSLASDWVQREITLAQRLHRLDRLKAVLVFIIDGTPHSLLPKWIKTFTVAKLRAPKLIALRIASRLMELDLDSGLRSDVFVGRDDVRGEIKSVLSAAVEETPVAICVSGWHGIGRRTLLRKALFETFSWLPQVLPEVHLGDAGGPSEFYRALLDYLDSRSPKEWQKTLAEFDKADDDRQTTLIVNVLKDLSRLRYIVIVKGNLSLVAENGDFQPWLQNLLFGLPRQNIPFLCMVCSRRVPPRLQARYRLASFFSLKSLSRTESKELLSALLKTGEAPVSSDFLETVTPIASGHPQNIRIVAEFARRLGAAAFKDRRQDFASLFTERANRLVELILERKSLDAFDDSTLVKKIVLKLFADFEYLSPDEILSFLEDREIGLVKRILHELEDFGVIEWEGRFFRLAPFVVDAVGFAPWDKETAEVRGRAAKEIIDRCGRYVDEEGVRLSVIDKATVAVLRNLATDHRKVSVTHQWLQAVALPSHYLRVAREAYDARKEQTASELLEKVLSFERGLTSQARIEALRLKGMCHARLNQAEGFFSVVRELEHAGGRVARRNAFFLRGFRARKGGNYDQAESAYRSAYKLDTRNFHVLRELSNVLLLQDKFQEALMFAESAVDSHPSNSYALDTLVGAKLGQLDRRLHQDDPEIGNLFTRLEEACAFDKTSFFDIRRAYFLARLGLYDTAIAHANEAKRRTPHLFAAVAVCANVYLMANDARKAGSAIRELERISTDDRTGEGKDANQLTKLRVRYALLRGDSQAALAEMERAQISANVRAILRKEIDDFEGHVNKGQPRTTTSRGTDMPEAKRRRKAAATSAETSPKVGDGYHPRTFVAPQFGKKGARRS